MLIALLLQTAIATQAQAPVDARALIAQQDAGSQGQSASAARADVRLKATVDKDGRVLSMQVLPRPGCNGGLIQAGITPGSVYRGEPVRSHPPIHVPGAYPDEGVYAAVMRFGPDGCMQPVPISLPYKARSQPEPRPQPQLRPRVR